MPRIAIESLDDPRIAVFANLKDRELAARHGKFIAEGQFVVERLLRSRFKTAAVFAAERCADEFEKLVPADVDFYVAPQQLMDQVIGYRFHTGVLAAGVREPSRALSDVVPADGEALILVLPEPNNNENLGGLIRVAAAFGATGILLGERACDPFFRQTIRVSMGTIFSMPIVQSRDILADLRQLGAMNVTRIATVLDEDAKPLAAAHFSSKRLAVLFGNEAQGLERGQVQLCDEKITIPMKLGTDSLNVAVSAGIILHHLVHVALRER